jgi:ribosomal protein S27E
MKKRQRDEIIYLRCIECGHVQADMGKNVACENCGFTMDEAEPVKATGREGG